MDYVTSRQPEKLMKSIDMTYSPKGYKKYTASESKLKQNSKYPCQSSESTISQTLKHSDRQVPVRGSRKGTHLNDPLTFDRRAPQTRTTIDNVPILPKLGSSDPNFFARMQDQKLGGMFRIGNRHLTDQLVYKCHQDTSDPFDRKRGKSPRRLSADRASNKPLEHDDIGSSKDLKDQLLIEPYKYTVFNLETKSSRINFRHDKKADAKKKFSSRTSWESNDDSFIEKNLKSKEEKVPPPENDNASLVFQNFVDPCWNIQSNSNESLHHYSPMLSTMYNQASNNSAISVTDSVISDSRHHPLVNNTDSHIYNMAERNDSTQFPEPPGGPERVEDGTMTSFVNWPEQRPMYMTGKPIYVHPVYYPIDDQRYGPQQYPPAKMIEASLKDFVTTSRPVTPTYFTPLSVESVPLSLAVDEKPKSKPKPPAHYAPVSDKIQVLGEAKKDFTEDSEVDITPQKKSKRKKKGFFRRMFGCAKQPRKDKPSVKPVGSPNLIVSPKGSKDRSEMRKVNAKQTSSQLLAQKLTAANKTKKQANESAERNTVAAATASQVTTNSSTPSVMVINVPNDRNVILAKQVKIKQPKKKKSAMKLRRPTSGSNKLTAIRRTKVSMEPKISEKELATTAPIVYTMHDGGHKGLAPVSSMQQLRGKSAKKPKRQKSSGRMCAGKKRSDDSTQTAGDPPYGSHDKHGYNHMEIV